MDLATSELTPKMKETLESIRSSLADITTQCLRASEIYSYNPDAAEDLLELISSEVEAFQEDFYDIIVQKCVNRLKINYTQGKLFDD